MTGPRILLVAGFAAAVIFTGPSQAFADSPESGKAVSAAQIVDKAAAFDGRTVTLEGEIIGEIMMRGSHAWINILDDGTAIGVWADGTVLGPGLSAGGYGRQGDRVRITGVMHRACVEHGGDLDIHLGSIEVLSFGRSVAHSVSRVRTLAAVFLSVTGAVFYLVWRRRERSGGSA